MAWALPDWTTAVFGLDDQSARRDAYAIRYMIQRIVGLPYPFQHAPLGSDPTSGGRALQRGVENFEIAFLYRPVVDLDAAEAIERLAQRFGAR